jgi:hypothetical protein
MMRGARALVAWALRPASPVPLGWFRIAVALLLFAKVGMSRGMWSDLYGRDGFVGWWPSHAQLPGLPQLEDVADLLGPLGVSADQALYGVIALHCLALFALLLGVAARGAALGAFVSHLLLIHAGSAVLYGADYFAHVALTYCIIMPIGDAVSVPGWLHGRASRPSAAAGLTRRMLGLQLAIVYSVSGFEKARGVEWWNGEAIWRVLSMPAFNQFDVAWLVRAPWLATLAGWSVILIECGYAPFMACCRTRRYWLFAVTGMHLGIGLLMGMWIFGLVMIALSAAAFSQFGDDRVNR